MFVLGVNNPPTAPPMNASKKSMNSAGRYSVGAAQQESDLGKLLRTVQKAAISRDSNVMEIVLHPISCGYFLDFSQKCYCAENLNFYMAVDKYRDDCAVLDLKDPFCIATCKELADKIWADFISLNSPNEVSLPSEDREETERRMKKPEVYGVNLFDVALKDALKTLQKDTLQRFLKSPQYTEMVNKLRSILKAETIREAQSTMLKTTTNKNAPFSKKYEIDFPKKTNLTEEKIDSLHPKDLSLDEILNDRILFAEMLNYLERMFKAENLKCARQIRHFEELAIEKKPDELKEYAWGIYLNFIAPGCPYEISCTSIQRKYIQLRLGCPIKTMFDGIKESTMLVLKLEHKTFCAHLTPKALKDRLKSEHSGALSPRRGGFLSKIF